MNKTDTPHQYGELYPDGNGQRRYVLTRLHKDCGGLVVAGSELIWAAVWLQHDGTWGCVLCRQQPLVEEDTYLDYC